MYVLLHNSITVKRPQNITNYKEFIHCLEFYIHTEKTIKVTNYYNYIHNLGPVEFEWLRQV